jgi:hypothetical protein
MDKRMDRTLRYHSDRESPRASSSMLMPEAVALTLLLHARAAF